MIEYYYQEEIKALNKNKIRYLVVGGVAVNLYGLMRLTRDLDLMLDLSEDNLEKFLTVFTKLGYYTKVPKMKWKDLVAIAFRKKDDEDKRVDIFMRNPIEFESAYKRRKIFRAKKFRISCVAFDDLINMKNKADRLRDWIDVGSLERIRELENKK